MIIVHLYLFYLYTDSHGAAIDNNARNPATENIIKELHQAKTICIMEITKSCICRPYMPTI